LWSVVPLKSGNIEVERGLVAPQQLDQLVNTDRFKITDSGVSSRWLNGTSDAYYFANGDEHWEDGSITEDGEQAGAMYAKRMRKLETIKANLPDPVVYGSEAGAQISFVGWGSSRNTMRDVIAELAKDGVNVNYLHFSYVHPIKTDRLELFFKENQNIHLIEGNYQGQLGELIRSKTDLNFMDRLLKFNGRPFFTEDVKEYIEKNLNS